VSTSAPLRFVHAHATHPQPELALELVWAQLASVGATQFGATLGWCYMTEELADGAQAIMARLRAHLPHVAWVGGVGAGVLATGVEYFDEPALAVMLCNLPLSDWRVFHGRQPLPPAINMGALAPSGEPVDHHSGAWQAHTAQVHADGHSPDLPDLIKELAERVATGYLFGGISTGQSQSLHLALDPDSPVGDEAPQDAASGVWRGGLSGVAFSERVRLVSRVTQGCEPVGPRREVTAAHRNVVYELDGLPALNCLLRDIGVPLTINSSDWQRDALPKVRTTLVGLSDAGSDLLSHGAHLGSDTRVRHLVGLDPSRYGIALSDLVEPGMQLAFCQRHTEAARKDLVRICAEIREEFDPSEHPGSRPAGAIYISCAGRGGPHFGAPNAEMEIIAHALGDIPLVGIFAGGEIARHHLYGYTGVLTVFGG
jgi:small ligand-binding sensory domain FIST